MVVKIILVHFDVDVLPLIFEDVQRDMRLAIGCISRLYTHTHTHTLTHLGIFAIYRHTIKLGLPTLKRAKAEEKKKSCSRKKEKMSQCV